MVEGERDGKGGFVEGNSGGPGRHKLAKEQEYLKAMHAICTVEAWEAIVTRATLDAAWWERSRWGAFGGGGVRSYAVFP